MDESEEASASRTGGSRILAWTKPQREDRRGSPAPALAAGRLKSSGLPLADPGEAAHAQPCGIGNSSPAKNRG